MNGCLPYPGQIGISGSTDSKIYCIKNIVMIFKPDAMEASISSVGAMEIKVLNIL